MGDKKRIVFLFPTNRKKLVEQVRRGEVSDNGLYGLNHLEKSYNVQVVDISAAWERVLNILLWPIAAFFNSRHTKLNLARAVLGLSKLNRADAVITCVDSVNKAACLLKKLGILRRPLICMTGNVLDGTESFLFLHRWLWLGADGIITHALVDQEKLIRLGLVNRGVVIPVGSDRGFWQKVRLPRPRQTGPRNDSYGLVVSVGADRDRDYRTLFLAAAQLPKLRFIVCCGHKNIERLKIPDNVEVKINVSSAETREILSKAEMVVLPLRETYRASGQLALLDAMLMGKPVIVSRARGVVEPYGLENGKQVLLPPPGDVESLVKAIGKLDSNGKLRRKLGIAGRELALEYTTEKYAKKLKKILDLSS